jgi:hypothetical protein
VRLSPSETLKKAAPRRRRKPSDAVASSPTSEAGHQAIAATAADLPPRLACIRPSHANTNTRHGTVGLLAGIDLVTGKVHALVRTPRGREFTNSSSLTPPIRPTPIKLILDNHSAHLKERRGFGATPHRFGHLPPKTALAQSSGFFSKLARSVLRHIHVSKQNSGSHHGRHGLLQSGALSRQAKTDNAA